MIGVDKSYLGDEVFADTNGENIVLTKADSAIESVRIILTPRAIASLVTYIRMFQERGASSQELADIIAFERADVGLRLAAIFEMQRRCA